MNRDRGAATLQAAGVVLALLLLLTFGLQLGAAVLSRHRAEGAADLAALAAAAHIDRGGDLACATAGRVARGMDVSVTSCSVHGWQAWIRTRAEPAGVLAGFASSSGRARAGPA
ncbi:Rv3654c family TadE-like protein [Allosaccharopolyspora coralli]|uniref:Rv3654c family TadE-like protein n=1 Tax=Allosaccharopolyspora coralli TaxID=2665642 RepID=UPI00165258A5|nr:Rv3654c family TadE-like protein [Allosaccharopolyspora coralli]